MINKRKKAINTSKRVVKLHSYLEAAYFAFSMAPPKSRRTKGFKKATGSYLNGATYPVKRGNIKMLLQYVLKAYQDCCGYKEKDFLIAQTLKSGGKLNNSLTPLSEENYATMEMV